MAFSKSNFLSLLSTRFLGRNVDYHASIESTQELMKNTFQNYPLGSVVVADVQSKGKGRGENVWTSPEGCLMFSFLTKVNDGRKLPFFQYLLSLAMVKSIREFQSETNKLPVFLKWPNDIYTTEFKIGGILCTSEYFKNEFHVISGIGLNVLNDEPTTSIQKLIREHANPNLEISREQVLAGFFNELEPMLFTFEREGFTPFFEDYYKYWLHSNQKVFLEENGSNIPVWITGLSETGYLKAKDEAGTEFELHPDGNSLDFFRGLIRAKLPNKP